MNLKFALSWIYFNFLQIRLYKVAVNYRFNISVCFKLLHVAVAVCKLSLLVVNLMRVKNIFRPFLRKQKRVQVVHGFFVAYCHCLIHLDMTVLRPFGGHWTWVSAWRWLLVRVGLQEIVMVASFKLFFFVK